MRTEYIATLASLLLVTPGLAAQQNVNAATAAAIADGHIDPDVFDPSFVHFECGTNSSTAPKDLLQAHHELHTRSFRSPVAVRADALQEIKRQAATSLVVVPTYFHIVTTAAKKGTVTAIMPQQQLVAMNTAYAGTGFAFKLAQITYTVNDTWATASDFAPMQKALRQGLYGALNLYFVSDLAGNILGQCSMPTNINNSPPSGYVTDGCLIHAGTMPGASINGYNQGKTAVHETGHWLGLLHTFEGYSCSGNGDFIADTNPELTSTSGCPANKTTCTGTTAGSPGDPVHNYMDYSTDACYTNFTPGQISRMQTFWTLYRKDYLPASLPDAVQEATVTTLPDGTVQALDGTVQALNSLGSKALDTASDAPTDAPVVPQVERVKRSGSLKSQRNSSRWGWVPFGRHVSPVMNLKQ
ncbi:zincin [Microthyrium microscopicum]|uniref:Zincin n=1 Tax=Microthyrium microscopicum TaxID=703497 RepID=A0A6A6ULF7_9PEZI|nr:zincin [Microthyrium microscopicum]